MPTVVFKNEHGHVLTAKSAYVKQYSRELTAGEFIYDFNVIDQANFFLRRLTDYNPLKRSRASYDGRFLLMAVNGYNDERKALLDQLFYKHNPDFNKDHANWTTFYVNDCNQQSDFDYNIILEALKGDNPIYFAHGGGSFRRSYFNFVVEDKNKEEITFYFNDMISKNLLTGNSRFNFYERIVDNFLDLCEKFKIGDFKNKEGFALKSRLDDIKKKNEKKWRLLSLTTRENGFPETDYIYTLYMYFMSNEIDIFNQTTFDSNSDLEDYSKNHFRRVSKYLPPDDLHFGFRTPYSSKHNGYVLFAETEYIVIYAYQSHKLFLELLLEASIKTFVDFCLKSKGNQLLNRKFIKDICQYKDCTKNDLFSMYQTGELTLVLEDKKEHELSIVEDGQLTMTTQEQEQLEAATRKKSQDESIKYLIKLSREMDDVVKYVDYPHCTTIDERWLERQKWLKKEEKKALKKNKKTKVEQS